MTQATNSDPRQSGNLRSMLEHTFVLAQAWGMVSTTESEWQYHDHEHLLVYNPVTQELQFINTLTDESLWWGNEEPIGNFHLTADQWAEFQELSEWLDTQDISQSIEIDSMQLPLPKPIVSLESTATQLFEYYASQEVPAYQLSENSTIHYYSVEIDGITYCLSRDDATGDYNLQREDTELDVRSHQGITQRDIQTWLEIGEWLSALVEMDSSQHSAGQNFDWEVGTESIEP